MPRRRKHNMLPRRLKNDDISRRRVRIAGGTTVARPSPLWRYKVRSHTFRRLGGRVTTLQPRRIAYNRAEIRTADCVPNKWHKVKSKRIIRSYVKNKSRHSTIKWNKIKTAQLSKTPQLPCLSFRQHPRPSRSCLRRHRRSRPPKNRSQAHINPNVNIINHRWIIHRKPSANSNFHRIQESKPITEHRWFRCPDQRKIIGWLLRETFFFFF